MARKTALNFVISIDCLFVMRSVSRWVSLILLMLLAGLQVKLWVSGGMRDVWRLEQAVAQQQAENANQQGRNEQLTAEVSDLKEGAEAVEERARSELGMVKNDEVFYQVIEAAGLESTPPTPELVQARDQQYQGAPKLAQHLR
jgi:cell division protein FtsB